MLSQKDNSLGSGIISHEEFKALVKYERARSDRNGSIFSITIFSDREQGAKSKDTIVSAISRFSRSIDCIGLGEEGEIMVLLPDTQKHGAEIFGEKVLSGLVQFEKVKDGQVDLCIYCYPENWLPSDPALPERKEGKACDPIKDKIELLFVEPIPLWKRILDVGGASLFLIMTSPIFLFLAIYIKLVSPGPIFFKQTRVGYRGIPFDFWKFRTMKCGNDQNFHGDHARSFILDGDIPMEKLDNRDPRIIPGGRVIRKCCLDELPQFWNAFRGDMSLVGPRPCIPYEAKEYLRWHTHRFDVLPGLSGLWQVSGKNKLTFKQMVRLDILYCDKITLLGDLAIIIRTPFVIMKMILEAIINKYYKKDAGALSISLPRVSGKTYR
jgi:lipopolysaccharide/colanic/teichoic acid biosynthesis glycosyltransferase